MIQKLKSKTGIHLLVWVSIFTLMVVAMSTIDSLTDAILRVAVFLGIHAAVFYIHSEVNMPKFFDKKRYFFFTISVVLTLFLSSMLLSVIVTRYIETNKGHHIRQVFLREHLTPENARIFHRTQAMKNGASMLGVLFISTVVSLASSRNKKEQESIRLRNEVLAAESKFLKSQINPHFLFNALNNIYSLAEMQSKKTAPSIMKLSEMLRYVLYDADVEMVNIEKEIEYLKGYIDLQLLKDDSISNVKYSFNTNNCQFKIPPMLLIPFVENAFKHGSFENVEKGWITIDLAVIPSNEQLILKVSNSIVKRDVQKDKIGGIGLKNVKTRLAILYKDAHELVIEEKEESFSIELKLDLYEA